MKSLFHYFFFSENISIHELKLPRSIMFKNRICPECCSFPSVLARHCFYRKSLLQNGMKECLATFFWVFWVLLLFITMFIDWIIECCFFWEFRKSQKLMASRFCSPKCMFLLVTAIKNLPKVVMQQYNYPKLIWMKQNSYFACSNYGSNWHLTTFVYTWVNRTISKLGEKESWTEWGPLNCNAP